MGIKRIDLCILSHLHLDHGGLGELCSLFDVKQIMTCPESAAGVVEMICLNQSARSQGRFLDFGAANEITDSIPPITEAKAGEAYQIGGAAINVFILKRGMARILKVVPVSHFLMGKGRR